MNILNKLLQVQSNGHTPSFLWIFIAEQYSRGNLNNFPWNAEQTATFHIGGTQFEPGSLLIRWISLGKERGRLEQ